MYYTERKHNRRINNLCKLSKELKKYRERIGLRVTVIRCNNGIYRRKKDRICILDRDVAIVCVV